MRPSKEPISGLALLFYKLRTGGAAWLADRLRREWQLPTTSVGRRLYRGARRLRRAPAAASLPASGQRDLLYAFYDLAVAPITFDFLWFLAGAEIARQHVGADAVHVVIVPGRDDGVRRERPDYDRTVDSKARRARIGNVLIPATGLLPSITGVTLASTREQAAQLATLAGAATFPADYEVGAPVYPGARYCLAASRSGGAQIAALRATAADLRAVEDWLAAKGCRARIVTITLRAYGYMNARDSNLAAWIAFAQQLDPARFSAVFVPDTEQVLSGLPDALRGCTIFPEAAINVGLRMALYERAFLNLGVNSGPMGLCWLNDRTRYLTFKLLTPSVPQATPEYVASHGFELGKSLPFATPWQKWVWADDELTVIEREFDAMVRRIDEEATSSPAELAAQRG